MAVEISQEQINALLGVVEAAEEIYNYEVTRALNYLGTEAVNLARDRGQDVSWIDRTGNLRSSIGEGVNDHGRSLFREGFGKVLDGAEGQAAGKRMLENILNRYKNTIALVIVAGMDYASDVEALDSKDVLASAELLARDKVDSYVRQAIARADRRINEMLR